MQTHSLLLITIPSLLASQVPLSPLFATITYQCQGRTCTQLCCGSREGELNRPGAMAGHSGALFIALHHQIWGLLPLCHHVPLLYNAQRQFFLSGVTRLSSPLASSQVGVLPGRVRDHKAGSLIQAHSAFPSPPCLAVVGFKRGTIIAAMLCWVSKDLTRQYSGYQEMQIQSQLHRVSYTS